MSTKGECNQSQNNTLHMIHAGQSEWINSLCVVTFDVELGQALEYVYPVKTELSETEKSNICYLSFPDSNSALIGDTQFHFRVRRSDCFNDDVTVNLVKQYNHNSPPAQKADPAYLFGFVYFRQIKDRNTPRGYLQKSVVLLSHLPLFGLFTYVLQRIALQYFNSGEASLEAAYSNILQWPGAKPGALLSLPLVGRVIQVRLASQCDRASPVIGERSASSDDSTVESVLLTAVHEYRVFESLLPVINHVQFLWELVLLGEPIVVMGSNPTLCAGLVQGLIGLICPLRYCNDYRPFFTIHDSEFREFTSTSDVPNVMLGVTNPFFAKTLQHWPHIIRIGNGGGGHGEASTSNNSFIPTFAMTSQRLKRGGDIKTLDSKPGFYSKYKPCLKKDKIFLRKLYKGAHSKRPVEVQQLLLSRHFLEITQSFMIPLERYIASLMPLQRNISPYKSSPRVKTFNVEEFLLTLDTAGPQLTSGIKGDWILLYRKFFASLNFEYWYKQRLKEVNHKLQLLHLETLCKEDFVSKINGRSEVEVVDLVLKLRDKKEFVEKHRSHINDELLTKLDCQFELVVQSLSEDMRMVLATKSHS